MDPDAALREIREICASGGSQEDFERLLELICGLDTWLQRGGTLPEDWAPLQLLGVVEALAFYARPSNYHAIGFVFDRPCGDFAVDFDEDHGNKFYDRPMPGKRARAALDKARKEMGDGRKSGVRDRA